MFTHCHEWFLFLIVSRANIKWNKQRNKTRKSKRINCMKQKELNVTSLKNACVHYLFVNCVNKCWSIQKFTPCLQFSEKLPKISITYSFCANKLDYNSSISQFNRWQSRAPFGWFIRKNTTEEDEPEVSFLPLALLKLSWCDRLIVLGFDGENICRISCQATVTYFLRSLLRGMDVQLSFQSINVPKVVFGRRYRGALCASAM